MALTTTSNYDKHERLELKLYISGMAGRSMEAIVNIKKICDDFLKGGYELKIIDLYKNPELASEHQIVFSPSLIKSHPLPKKILVGTFSDTNKVMSALGLSKL